MYQKKKNLDLRRKAKENGVNLWEIADKLGISETYFNKKLRYELSQGEKENVISIIEEIVKERF